MSPRQRSADGGEHSFRSKSPELQRPSENSRMRCSDSGDDAKHARETTFHARSRTQSGEVLRRCREARGEKRKFVNKSDGEETMPASEVDVEKKALGRKTNHQPFTQKSP